MQRFFLDLAALVAEFHRAEHTAALADRLEFLEHRFFDEVGQFIEDEGPLVRILVLGQAPFAVDDELDRHRATHRFFGRRGDRFIVGIGMQRVGVVVGRDQRLQRGADVVERDFLRMQAAPAGLRMEFELLAAFVGAVFFLHRHRPNPARHAPDHRILGVHAVREKERQVGREIIDVHAARQIRFHVSETVAERERQLADRVGPGLGDVITADADRIEIPHVVLDEIRLDVAHHLEAEFGAEQTSVLALVFLQDVGLHRAAHRRERPAFDFLDFVVGRRAAVVGLELRELLIDRRVQIHREDGRRRAVDRHAHAGVGRAQIEAVVQHFEVVERRDADARIADLAVNVGPQRRVVAVKRDRIESGGQPLGRHAFADEFEAFVGPKRIALAREHARRVFAFALEREHARGVRIRPRHVFEQQPFELFAFVFEARQHDLADLGA